MVVAHGLAPVGEREIRIGLLRFPKRFRGFVEFEAVEVFHALDEQRLGRGGAGSRELNRAKLGALRDRGSGRKSEPSGDRNQTKPANTHMGLRLRLFVRPFYKRMGAHRSDFA